MSDISRFRRTLLALPRQIRSQASSLGLWDALAIGVLLLLAILIRLALIQFKSLDFYASLKPWYNTISEQGFAAFSTGFSTYSPPYLYLLYLIARFFPDTPVVVAVKIPSLAADLVLAVSLGSIVKACSPGHRFAPIACSLVALFSPTVILNGSFWGQADSIYTAGILLCLLFLLRGRSGWAMIAFGVALSFKLQAIFLAPLIAALTLRGQVKWKNLALIPGLLVLSLVPAGIAGRPFNELLGIYPFQAGQFEALTMNAPSAYAWLPETKRIFNLFYGPGILAGLAAAFLWFVVMFGSRRPLRGRLLIAAAAICFLIVPFLLPKMHDRYFFPADVLSIAVAFLYPELLWFPFAVTAISFAAYQPFLFEQELVPLGLLALGMAAVIVVVSKRIISEMYGNSAPAHGNGLSLASGGEETSEARP